MDKKLFQKKVILKNILDIVAIRNILLAFEWFWWGSEF